MLSDTTRAAAESAKDRRASNGHSARSVSLHGTGGLWPSYPVLSNQDRKRVPLPKRAPPKTLTAILRTLQTAGKSSTVSVGDLTDALGARSFGPLLLVPSLILITPLSGIPGAPTTGAIIIVLVALQMVVGSNKVWLPEFVRKRTLRRTRINSVTKRLKPAARFLDRITSRRLTFLTHRPFSLLLVIPCIVLALAMPPLEIVPMTSTILATGIFLLALALTAQDGLLGLISLLLTVGAVVLALVLIF